MESNAHDRRGKGSKGEWKSIFSKSHPANAWKHTPEMLQWLAQIKREIAEGRYPELLPKPRRKAG